MNDRTTIQLKESTKDDLAEIKRAEGESYDSVVKLLIAHYNNSQESEKSLDEATVRNIVQEEINDMVAYKALE